VFFILTLKNAVPTFVVDAPGGGGKIALQHNYLISQSADNVVLRNFGVITTYPEPQNYVAGRAEDYFKKIYSDFEDKKSLVGIAGLMNDVKPNLVPEGLNRLERKKEYETNPEHTSLKDKLGKRDQLKEKKFQAQISKGKESVE
jgi:lysine 2,3-aminomutase